MWFKKKNPYHFQVFHNLQEEDNPRRAALCAELIDQIERANLINKILSGDETTFHTRGKGKGQSTWLSHLGGRETT